MAASLELLSEPRWFLVCPFETLTSEQQLDVEHVAIVMIDELHCHEQFEEWGASSVIALPDGLSHSECAALLDRIGFDQTYSLGIVPSILSTTPIFIDFTQSEHEGVGLVEASAPNENVDSDNAEGSPVSLPLSTPSPDDVPYGGVGAFLQFDGSDTSSDSPPPYNFMS